MEYGHFDAEHREYVITRPDTPAPWSNYLGTPAYGAIVTNNAGGYSFVKSGATGRLTRYRFNAVPTDQAGRYIYLRDRESADYWSASWQPVGKPLDTYESVCRHGTGYTVITSKYEGIESEVTYYVPMVATHEVWHLLVRNASDRSRRLSIYGYVELTNDSHYEQDGVNLQYTSFTTHTHFRGNYILQRINELCSDNARFFGAVPCDGSGPVAYEGDRDSFVGPYRSYANPIAVERGRCGNKLNYNLSSCGCLQFDIDLAPGEERTIDFILGEGGDAAAKERMAGYGCPTKAETELAQIVGVWHSRLGRFKVETPDANFNHMVNTWNAYQCFTTFVWSRAASLIYCGLRNGLGYRDTVQDIQGIIHLDSRMAAERLRHMISAQVDNGGGLPLVKWTHNAGHENTPDDPDYVRETGHPSYRADDALWLFPTTNTYMMEVGSLDFLDEVVPFANGGEATVYEHLRRAIQFNLDRVGDHGLPAGLHADWNDCLRLGAKGESAFVAFQLYYAAALMKGYAQAKGRAADVAWCEALASSLDDKVQTLLWNEDRFVRGITEDGHVVGHRDNEEGSMWLNPQSWAVISGAAKGDQGLKAMESVHQHLNTQHGVRLFTPAFEKFGMPVALMVLFNKGTKENGAIFAQPQGWAILAETLLGHGSRAFEYYTEINPASKNATAETRVIEPYAHGQFIEGPESPFFGRAHVHWLTGTASTVMVAMVYGILGVRPALGGISISPCIPANWSKLTIERDFRGTKLLVTVDNSAGVEKGVVRTIVNGQEVTCAFVPEAMLKPTAEGVNEITVVMG